MLTQNFPHTPNQPASTYTDAGLRYEWERIDEIVGRIVANVAATICKPLADQRVALSNELTRRGITAMGHC